MESESAEMSKILQDYKMPEDLKEVVHRIAQDAEDIDLRLSEFKFIHASKMLAVAVGGSIFFLGVLFVLVSIFMLFNMFDVALDQSIRIAAGSTAAVLGAVQLLGGLLLIGK